MLSVSCINQIGRRLGQMEKIVPEVVFQVAMVVKSVDTTIKQLTEYLSLIHIS